MINDGKHIGKILDRTVCVKHRMPKGVPCYTIYTGGVSEWRLPGICGKRIKAAGYNGTISQTSLSSRGSGGRTDRPKR